MSAHRLGQLGALTLALSLAAALSACGSDDPVAPASGGGGGGDTVVVGSFLFPESEILGEIYAQALEADGVDVRTKFNIGPRQQTIPALQDGSINLIPEYNGNLLAYYNPDYTERTTEEVDGALGDAVAKDELRVLDSASAEDKDAYVVTSETARRTTSPRSATWPSWCRSPWAPTRSSASWATASRVSRASTGSAWRRVT